MPQTAYYARDLCTWQADIVQTMVWAKRELEEPFDLSADAAVSIIMRLAAEQQTVSTLTADARVQDPSFQCFGWDFSPPEDSVRRGR